MDFHEKEPSCYEEILMDLQQVINIMPQCLSKVLLSWDVNRINMSKIVLIYLSVLRLMTRCEAHGNVFLSDVSYALTLL